MGSLYKYSFTMEEYLEVDYVREFVSIHEGVNLYLL